MVFGDCSSNSNILNDLKKDFLDFSSLRPRTVLCMVSFMEKICVLARSENRESGPLLL